MFQRLPDLRYVAVIEQVDIDIDIDTDNGNATVARIVGLDLNHDLASDIQFPTNACSTAWNTITVPLEVLALP